MRVGGQINPRDSGMECSYCETENTEEAKSALDVGAN